MPTYTGTVQFYNDFAEQLTKGVHNSGDTYKMGLVTSSYTFSAAHTILTDITNEVSGNGYARQTLSVSISEASGVATWDFTDPVFVASGGNWTARRWFIFNDSATSPADALVCSGLINSADADVTVTDGNDLTYVVNASGLFQVSMTGA